MSEISYMYYIELKNGYINKFIERNPEFNNKAFIQFVMNSNKGYRDSGELQDIAKHEILRLAHAWTVLKWRLPELNDRTDEWNN